MRSIPTAIPEVLEVRMPRFGDDRGWFAEMWGRDKAVAAGLPDAFVQDNESFSRRGVLRGLHYQVGQPQGKLVRVLQGEIFDVAVDLRSSSATYGQHVSVRLAAPSADDAGPAHAFWIPEGFAHGFCVLSETAQVLYKTTGPYYPAGDRCLLWNAPELAIEWPIAPGTQPVLSAKDAAGASWNDAEKF